jgi:hypothetical protein
MIKEYELTSLAFDKWVRQHKETSSFKKANRAPKQCVIIGKKRHYIYVLIDLFNRDIISHSSGSNKTADPITRTSL